MLVVIIVVVAVVWVVVGLAIRVALMRRGHRSASMFAAVLAGPLLGVALIRTATAPRGWQEVRVLAPGASGTGSLGVLVGIDGSPEAQAAVRTVVDLFGPKMGGLTLATVVSHEFRDAAERQHVEHEARTWLAGTAQIVTGRDEHDGGLPEPQLVVVAGEPATELLELARRKGVDVMAVGRRGAGVSKILLGSVATQLAHKAPIPVMIVGT